MLGAKVALASDSPIPAGHLNACTLALDASSEPAETVTFCPTRILGIRADRGTDIGRDFRIGDIDLDRDNTDRKGPRIRGGRVDGIGGGRDVDAADSSGLADLPRNRTGSRAPFGISDRDGRPGNDAAHSPAGRMALSERTMSR